MAQDLADDALDNDLVAGDVQLLRLILDIHNDCLSPLLMLLLVKLAFIELGFDALFNNGTNFSWVEAFMFSWLHPISGQVGHAWVSEIDHLVSCVYFYN